MARILRFDSARGERVRRWALGVAVAGGSRLDAALLSVTGRGLDVDAQIAAFQRVSDRELAALFGQLAPTGGAVPSLGPLRAHLAESVAGLIQTLIADSSVPQDRVAAVAVRDCGFWQSGRTGPDAHVGLTDAARLAELTGLSVIDGFTERDLACGGQGGPVTAVAQWLLLRHPKHTRALLDLGRTIRMTFLPAGGDPCALSGILSFDVGPGMRLVDLLAQRLTGGQSRFDPGGRLAVQGRRINELVDRWLADASVDRPLPHWHPNGMRPERLLTDALKTAAERAWSIRDLLCTATHFLAEMTVRAIGRRLPAAERLGELVLSGGGQHNGMLLREIGARLPEVPLLRSSELGIEDEALDAAATAMLGVMFLDRVPANSMAITGAEVPRVLGRLTPGSAQNWQRLIQSLGGSCPVVRPLRSAM